MDKGLRTYLARCRPANVDETLIASLHKEMAAAVPEIVESIRQREIRAAQLRRGCTCMYMCKSRCTG